MKRSVKLLLVGVALVSGTVVWATATRTTYRPEETSTATTPTASELRVTATKPLIHPSVHSVETADAYAIGTWTGADTIAQVPRVDWIRVVFRNDHTFQYWAQAARADNWGKPLFGGTWKACMDTYLDTGKRYYCVDLQWDTRGNPLALNGGQIERARYTFVDGNKLRTDEASDQILLSRKD